VVAFSDRVGQAGGPPVAAPGAAAPEEAGEAEDAADGPDEAGSADAPDDAPGAPDDAPGVDVPGAEGPGDEGEDEHPAIRTVRPAKLAKPSRTNLAVLVSVLRRSLISATLLPVGPGGPSKPSRPRRALAAVARSRPVQPSCTTTYDAAGVAVVGGPRDYVSSPTGMRHP
jgi:hypothetical protein